MFKVSEKAPPIQPYFNFLVKTENGLDIVQAVVSEELGTESYDSVLTGEEFVSFEEWAYLPNKPMNNEQWQEVIKFAQKHNIDFDFYPYLNGFHVGKHYV